MKKGRTFIFAGLLMACACVQASAQQQTLQQIERQIAALEKDLKAKESKERTTLGKIEDLNREIGLRKSLLTKLRKEQQSSENAIKQTGRRLKKSREEYARLREIVRTRIISMYKRGRVSNWEMLFTAATANKAMVWLRYQQIIVENDRRNLRLLREKSEEIQVHQRTLTQELNRKKQLADKKESETKLLEKKQDDRETYLAQVRKDKQLIQKRLAQKRASYKDILNRIKSEEAKRKHAVTTIGSTGFAARQGKLPWPVTGSIVSKYGRHLQAVLKTWIENIGVDIKGRSGSGVHAVNRGVVKWVTWQRGMDNIVLLYHGDGYYTVYGHLETVLVASGQTVNTGDVIGTLGDNTSLEGPMLHFEVWKGENHYNPEKWLAKK